MVGVGVGSPCAPLCSGWGRLSPLHIWQDAQYGRLVRLQETGSPAPAGGAFDEQSSDALLAASDPPTSPVAGGEIELRLTIQAVFEIN